MRHMGRHLNTGYKDASNGDPGAVQDASSNPS